MDVVQYPRNSSGWLLARPLTPAGAVVTDASPAGTTCTLTFTSPSGAVLLSGVTMTWDAAFVATDPADGVAKTGWWKYLAAYTVFATLNRHRATATVVNSGTRREIAWDVLVVEGE